MLNPLAIWTVIPAAGKRRTRDIVLTEARTLTLTCRCTYNGSATKGARVNVLSSPDGKNFDTVPMDFFDIDLTTSATIQETAMVAIPEHGWIKVEVENLDAAQTVTDVKLWYTIQSWPPGGKLQRGGELNKASFEG